MTTMMDRAITMLNRRLPSAAGGSIVYSRNAETVTLSAAYGRTEFSVETVDGVRVEYSDRDFIVAASTLLLSGVAVIPQRGDRVAVLDGDGTPVEHFEVLAPASMPPYRFSDSGRQVLRIHTKRLPQ